jgi:hypothetical protein
VKALIWAEGGKFYRGGENCFRIQPVNETFQVKFKKKDQIFVDAPISGEQGSNKTKPQPFNLFSLKRKK